MTTINEREVTCVFCKEKFIVMEASSFTIAEKESDFFPHYLGANPLPIMVESCPKCGYTSYTKEFEDKLTKKKKGKVAKTLKSIQTEKKLSPSEKYRSLALIYIARDKNAVEVADCYLKAAWCERLEDNRDEELSALRKAANYFELGLKANEVSGTEELITRYLVGEIFRRLGEKEKTLKFWKILKDELAMTDKTDNWLSRWLDEGLRKI